MDKIAILVGARPNFIKAWALLKAAKAYPDCEVTVLSTGQHTGQMADPILQELDIRPLELPVKASQAPLERLGRQIEAIGAWLLTGRPDGLVVVGDVDSTLAGAIAAAKTHTRLVHVEAGLRCGDLRMQEEINRILVDSVAGICFTTSVTAFQNLIKEGHDANTVHFVGNVMIDTLLGNKDRIDTSLCPTEPYALLTLHRPENVDHPETLRNIMRIMDKVSREIQIVYVSHPRVQQYYGYGRILRIPPTSYFKFLGLLSRARFIITDSGGACEEACAFNVPCLTIRDCTERPETVTWGSNHIVGTDTTTILRAVDSVLGPATQCLMPPLWDGQAADRIMAILNNVPSHTQ
jgi:UDP-N-acetylglucosamine 2-epimerase (non-hydrolysing)